MIHDRTSQRPPRPYDPTQGDRRCFTFHEALSAAERREQQIGEAYDVAIFQVPLTDASDAHLIPTFVVQDVEASSVREARVNRAIERAKAQQTMVNDALTLAGEVERLRRLLGNLAQR